MTPTTKDPRGVLDRAADFERRAALLDSQARIRAWLAAGGLPPATGPIHACFNRRGGCRCVRDGCAAAQERVDVFTPLFPIDPFDDYGFPVERSPNDFEALWCQLYELGPHRVKIGFAVGGDDDATAEASDLLAGLAERLIRFLCGKPKRTISKVVAGLPEVTHAEWRDVVWIQVEG